MVTWQFYFARRRVTDIRRWAFNRGITSYEELSQVLLSLGTTLPNIDEATRFFLPSPPVNIIPEIQPPIPVPTPKRESENTTHGKSNGKRDKKNVKENKENR